jgi:hypothetical protein
VPVELAAAQQLGQGQLFEGRGAPVGRDLRVTQGGGEPGRRDEPAEPDSGRERLARRAGVDDAVRGETLQGADGRPVVAVLGVAGAQRVDVDPVVLDRQAVRRGRTSASTA